MNEVKLASEVPSDRYVVLKSRMFDAMSTIAIIVRRDGDGYLAIGWPKVGTSKGKATTARVIRIDALDSRSLSKDMRIKRFRNIPVAARMMRRVNDGTMELLND